MMSQSMSRLCRTLLVLAVLGMAAMTAAQPMPEVQALVAKEKAPMLDTMKALVEIESGSADREGLDRIAALIGQRLQALGGSLSIEPASPRGTRLAAELPHWSAVAAEPAHP